MLKKLVSVAAATTMSVVAFSANAATLNATGEIFRADSSGVLTTVIFGASNESVFVNAEATLNDSISAANEVGENDLTSILVVAGAACIASPDRETDCPGGTSLIPANANPSDPSSYAQPGSLVTLTSGGTLTLNGTTFGQNVDLVLTFPVPTSDTTSGADRTITGSLAFSAANPFLGSASGDIDYTLTAPAVNPIPVPGSVWLMGSALAGVAAARRRRAA